MDINSLIHHRKSPTPERPQSKRPSLPPPSSGQFTSPSPNDDSFILYQATSDGLVTNDNDPYSQNSKSRPKAGRHVKQDVQRGVPTKSHRQGKNKEVERAADNKGRQKRKALARKHWNGKLGTIHGGLASASGREISPWTDTEPDNLERQKASKGNKYDRT